MREYAVIIATSATIVFALMTLWYGTRPIREVEERARVVRERLPKTKEMLLVARAWGQEVSADYLTDEEKAKARREALERAQVKRLRKAKRA